MLVESHGVGEALSRWSSLVVPAILQASSTRYGNNFWRLDKDNCDDDFGNGTKLSTFELLDT